VTEGKIPVQGIFCFILNETLKVFKTFRVY
jgi:hypothetical protein